MVRTTDPSIDVSDVTKRYRGEHVNALDDVTLHVEPGEFVVLAGPSGSGKSTLLHLIAGLDRPDSGRIVVAGFDTAHRVGMDHHRRRGVGLVFQLHNLLPHLTAAANLEIVMLGTHRGRRERRTRAEELLAAVGLAAQAGDVPPRLSGGERQRIAVARAFANNPTVILADEPTGSLDDVATAQVVALLHAHAAEGGTVLAVTHDARLLAQADRVVTLVAGRTGVVEAAAP
jgi:ABC-type lipoprotein export system ATPase subunit